ncbi:hypothetical protein [Pseudorhodoferax sp. Leaf267]|uniref:hypothetical protein n=1 Tax=Pseudorhodoferax sp. Leaf267 TaxID=1736316 RepID=UPI0006F4B9EC|nr:hypothetical protein [Pseudorhodoferax sp. Leaf267]KQP12795.1 hypothetical protein ASF43_21535 [Pseudorhodoferax sp. Leaf267]
MKTTSAQLVDVFSPYPPVVQTPSLRTLLAGLAHQALERVGRTVCTDSEAARNAYLAEAASQADLERRAAAWERAQSAYRSLPPAL